MTLYTDDDYAPPLARRASPLRRALPVILLIVGVVAGFAIYRFAIDRGKPAIDARAVTARGGTTRSISNSACFFPYQNENCFAAIDPVVGGMASCAAAVIRSAP